MNLVNNEYIIDQNDVINNSEIEETDLVEHFGEGYKFILAQLSQKTYRAIYSAYRGTDRIRQRKAIQYMINTGENSAELQLVVKQAIIEYVRAAIITGMDLDVYERAATPEERATNKVIHPRSVIEILREGGLWIPSPINYQDYEIE